MIILSKAWSFLTVGVIPLGHITEPGTLEGGDYIAAGTGLALLGVGLRTNAAAAEQMLHAPANWIGAARVAIVLDEHDRHQVQATPEQNLPYALGPCTMSAIGTPLGNCR
jgi:hypothetical protein